MQDWFPKNSRGLPYVYFSDSAFRACDGWQPRLRTLAGSNQEPVNGPYVVPGFASLSCVTGRYLSSTLEPDFGVTLLLQLHLPQQCGVARVAAHPLKQRINFQASDRTLALPVGTIEPGERGLRVAAIGMCPGYQIRGAL